MPAQPWVESPFFERNLDASGLDAREREQARFYRERGYLVLDDVFDPALLDQVVEQTRPLFDPAVENGMRSRIVRALDQTDLRADRENLAGVLASPSYRLGRAITAPLRALRGGSTRSSR